MFEIGPKNTSDFMVMIGIFLILRILGNNQNQNFSFYRTLEFYGKK